MMSKAEILMNKIKPQLEVQKPDSIKADSKPSFNIFDGTGHRYKNPVIGSMCLHKDKIFELLQVAEALSDGKPYKCPYCQNLIHNPSDIKISYLYTRTYQIFHPQTQMISILSGILMTKYRQTKRVMDCLLNEQNKNLINTLFERKSKENNISAIMMYDKKFQQQNKKFINFEVVCLQNFVKLVIPVRHKNCKHVSCYDISSLLILCQEAQGSKEDKLMPCNEDGCQSIFNFNSLQTLENETVLDEELFDCINMGYPGVTNFVFDFQNKRTCDIITYNNNVDPYIETIHKNLKLESDYQEFQASIWKLFQQIMDGDLNQQIKDQKEIYKYQTLNLSLKDIEGQMIIQYPARCVKCTQFNQFLDLRRFIILIKQFREKNIQEMQCPLCKSKISIRNNLNIYLDYDLMIRIHEMNGNSSQIDPYTLKYDGKKYMLQEFIQRHKTTIEKYSQSSNTQLIVIKSFYSQGIRLKDPLILIKCPDQNRISFEDFYDQFAKNSYKIKGLTLCKCQTCNANPLETFINSIYYDELLAYLLNNQIPENIEDQEIQYNITTKQITNLQKSKNSKILSQSKVMPGNPGFTEYMSEEEYADLFKIQTDDNGQYMYQVNNITQNIQGFNITIDQDGISNDGESRLEQMNKDIADNEWYMEIRSIKLTNGSKTLIYSQREQ